MSISTIDSSSTQAMPEIVEKGANTEMDKLDFLQLLTVQLANQDPTNPMDTDQMSQQTTMYASLEQLINLNENMGDFMQSQEDMLLGIASVFNTLESTGFLGKDVDVFTNSVKVDENGALNSLYYDLTRNADISCVIKNESGNIVKSLPAETVEEGNRIKINWDGTDDNGNMVPPGDYFVEMTAIGSDGTALSGKTYSPLNVKAVDFRSGTPLLTLENGDTLPATEIISVLEPNREN